MNDEVFAYVGSSPPGDKADPHSTRPHKLRVAVQPNLSVRGWPTEAGSLALDRYVAPQDATAVERLRGVGTTFVGSTRMSELGFGVIGDTAAEALTADRCDAAIVTDTMGEARYIAATAGAVGFKPSYGICSRFGLIGLVPSMECLGVCASSVERVSEVMTAVAGPDDRDFSMLAEGIPDFRRVGAASDAVETVGIVRECLTVLDASETDALKAALGRIEASGVGVREVSLADFDLFGVVHNVVGSTEASSSAGKYDSVRYGHRAEGTDNWNEMYLRSRAESFGPLVKSYLFQGAYFQFNDYPAFENACRLRGSLVAETRTLFQTVDALIWPTRRPGFDATAATTTSKVYDAFALTLPANVTGAPAVTLPGFVRCGGVDLGLHLLGPHLGDVKLLSFAGRLTAAGKGGR